MPKKIIYLAGAINGCTDAQCNDWRSTAKAKLEPDFQTLDPMRRDYRGREGDNVNEIVEGDLVDIAASDMILANCPKPGWGAGMEIFYAARTLGKPVVIIVPETVAVSPWLRYHSYYVATSLAEAVAIVRAHYTPRSQYANTYFGREQMKAC